MENILISAAREYVTNMAKIDKECGAPEKETRETTPIAYQAFIAGAEWYKNTGGGISKLWKQSIQLDGLHTFDEAQKVCPKGFRLPTEEEQMWLLNNSPYHFDYETKEGVFRLPDGFELRLPAAGYRLGDGDSYYQGTFGLYWSSSPSGADATNVYFNGGTAGVSTDRRINAFSVRCVPIEIEK